MNIDEYKQLVAKLNQLSKAYYEENDATYPDEVYDREYRSLLEFEKLNPTLIALDSPTQRIGFFTNTPFAKVKHRLKMQSLDNAFTPAELSEWVVKNPHLQYICVEPKCDGLALDLYYDNGVLKQALTRGDGTIGEDVTANVLMISNVPTRMKDRYSGNVRGEVLIPKWAFEIINEERIEAGEEPFANPRNAAAGALRQTDPEECRKRRCEFIAYTLLPTGNIPNPEFYEGQIIRMKWLRDQGFATVPSLEMFRFQFKPEIDTSNIDPTNYDAMPEMWKEHIEGLLTRLEMHRHESPYEIDGLVFKIVDTRLHTRTDAKTPKWAIAYKFPAEERQVELLDVVWQVGRTGMQTPVAVITPTYLGGVVIENITLHNPDFIKRNNITLPGLLTIIRSGDVIPKVVSAEPQGKPILIPTECGCCKTPLQWTETQKQIFCPNPSCETKLVLFWENFASRLAMNIIGLSVETIKELVAADYLTHRLDSMFMLYGFTESIKEWEGWSDVSTMNLVNAIDKAKTTDKQRVITALGIEGIGASNSKLIARTFKTLAELPDVTAEQISAIRGLGDVIADSWVQFWGVDSHRESYLEMLKLLNVVDDGVLQEVKGKYAMTGKMPEISRTDLERVLNSKGYDLTNTISADLKGLFVGDKPSSKLAKAQKLGIPLLAFEDLDKI